jgi:hypothetical protein
MNDNRIDHKEILRLYGHLPWPEFIDVVAKLYLWDFQFEELMQKKRQQDLVTKGDDENDCGKT